VRGRSPPRPRLAVPNVTAHPSTDSEPITVLLYNGPLHCCFDVPIKGLNSVSFWLLTFHTSAAQRRYCYGDSVYSSKHILHQTFFAAHYRGSNILVFYRTNYAVKFRLSHLSRILNINWI